MKNHKLKFKTRSNILTFVFSLVLLNFYFSLLTSLTLKVSEVKAATAVPQSITFQGKVVNADGTNVTDGAYDFEFKIYNGASSGASTLFTETWSSAALLSSQMSSAPGNGGTSSVYSTATNESSLKVGQVLWNTTKGEPVIITAVDTGTNTITHSATRQAWSTSDTITNRIYVKDGIFKVALNSLNANWGTVDFADDQLFLGINYQSDGEMKPRVQFTSSAYSFYSENTHSIGNLSATTATNDTTLTNADTGKLTIDVGGGNNAGEDLVLTAHNLQLTATGALTLSPDADVTTAIDLTDSNFTNALSLADNAILGTTAVINFDNFDVSSTGDITFLGGDLTGTNGETIDIGEADNGSFIFSATGETNNESIEFDLETAANTLSLFSSTGVVAIDLGSSMYLTNIGNSGTDFTATGGLTLDDILTVNDDLTINAAAGENLEILDSAAITTDLVSIVSDAATTTAGANALQIDFTTGDGASVTNSALEINGASGGSAAGDIFYGINLNMDAADASTQTAINLNANWDTDINAATDLTLGIGGTNEVTLTGSALYPSSDGGNALGITNTNEWAGLNLNTGAAINFENSDVTLTHSANTLTLAGGNLAIGTNTLSGGAAVIDFTEFDVSGTTGSITIDDDGNAGQISIDGSVLDIDSLTFVGAGAVNTTDWDISATGDLTNIGSITMDGRLDTAAHTNSVGLNVPTWGTTGAPSAVTGTAEGDVVYNTVDDALYVYDGAAFTEIGGGGYSKWTITDGTTPQDIDSGNTLTLSDSTTIDAVTSATDTLTMSVKTNSLDFSYFEDALDIDAATDIDLNAYAFTIDMDSTGSFSIRDVTTDIATFAHTGAITFDPTDGQAFLTNLGAGSNLQVAATAAPTVDLVSITNAGQGITTTGVDGLSLTFVTGNGADPTNNALNLALTSGGTGAGDVLNAINLALTGTSGTERGLNFADNNFDTDINAATDLTLGIGGTNEVTLTSSALSPSTTNGNSLGTSSLMWSDLFLASGAVINFDNSDVTLTHAANSLSLAGGDFNVEIIDGQTINFDGDGSPTADILTLGAGDTSATTGVDALQISFGSSNASGNLIDLTPAFAGGATDSLSFNVIDIDAFSPTNGAGTDTVRGINIGNLTDPGATITSRGIDIGTGWDTAFMTEGGTTGTAYLELASDQTSGTIMEIGAPSATTLTGAFTGLKLDLASNYTTGAHNVNGIDIALDAIDVGASWQPITNGINISGGAITQAVGDQWAEWHGVNIDMPDIADSDMGIESAGMRINMADYTGVASGVYQTGILVDPSATDTGSKLYGIDIWSAPAGSVTTRQGIRISTGWDPDISGETDLTFGINGFKETTLTTTAFSPGTNDGNALGTSSLMWSDLFLASSSVINFDAGDVTLTHSANTLTLAGGNLALGANTLSGTTAVINFDNFDVDSAGNVSATLYDLDDLGRVGLGASDARIVFDNNGTSDTIQFLSAFVGINQAGPDAMLDSLYTSGEQLRLTYADGTAYTGFTTDTNGDLTINASGNDITLSGDNLTVGGDLTVSGGDLYITGQASSASTTEGTIYYDTDDDNLYVYANGGWVDLTSQGTSEWTLSGGAVYPNLATTDLVIGGTTLASSIFSIDESTGTFLFGGDQSANPTLTFEATDSDTGNFGFNTNDSFYFSGAELGIGTTDPGAWLNVLGTTEQLRLSYDASNYTSFTVDSAGNLTIADTGTSIATFGAAQASFSVPTAFNAAGDASFGYDLVLTNDTASKIESYGPLSIQSGEIFENNNLTLTTYGTGNIILNPSGTGQVQANGIVASDYVAEFFNDGNNANRYGIQIQAGADDASGTTYYLNALDGDGGQVGYIANTSGTFALTDPSDIRTKTNVVDANLNGLDIINNLRVVNFNRLANPSGPTITGFIAQEVLDVYPEMVNVGPDGMYGLNKSALIPVLTKAIQEQQTSILAQITSIANLDSRLTTTESLITSLASDYSNLSTDILSHTSTLNNLTSQYAGLATEVSQLQQSVTDLDNGLQIMDDRISSNSAQISNLLSVITQQNAVLSNLSSGIQTNSLGVGVPAPATDSGKLVDTLSGAYLSASGVWTNVSDETKKTNFTEVDKDQILEGILELGITRWNYKSDSDHITHIGPTAQQFYSVFGVGDNDKTISTLDPASIALVGIQSLARQMMDDRLRITDVEQKAAGLEDQTSNIQNQVAFLLDLNNQGEVNMKKLAEEMEELRQQQITDNRLRITDEEAIIPTPSTVISHQTSAISYQPSDVSDPSSESDLLTTLSQRLETLEGLVLGTSDTLPEPYVSSSSGLRSDYGLEITDSTPQSSVISDLSSEIESSVSAQLTNLEENQSIEDIISPIADLDLSSFIATSSSDTASNSSYLNTYLVHQQNTSSYPSSVISNPSTITIDSLSVSTDLFIGSLAINGRVNSISTIGEPLRLQTNQLAGNIEAFDQKIVFTNNGDIQIIGTLTAGKVKTAEISADKTVAREAILGKISIATQSSQLASPYASQSAQLSSLDSLSENKNPESKIQNLESEYSPSIGTATLPARRSEITILNTTITQDSKVFITPLSLTDSPLSVTEVIAGQGFTVSTKSPSLTPVEFNWWIIN